MFRSLLAALLLLILSGSGAAFFMWSSASTALVSEGSGGRVEATSTSSSTAQAPAPGVVSPVTISSVPPTPTVPAQPPEADITPTVDATPDPFPTQASPAPSPTSAPVWSRATPAPRAPTRLVIPGVGVDAQVVSVGKTEAGHMEDPDDFAEVGWYAHGAAPGQPGRAVMAGHVDSTSGPAVFYHLSDIPVGTEIIVELGGGALAVTYIVQEIAMYPATDAPLDRIFGRVDHSELILITCGGNFDRATGTYDERVVVYASPAPAT